MSGWRKIRFLSAVEVSLSGGWGQVNSSAPRVNPPTCLSLPDITYQAGLAHKIVNRDKLRVVS
jgi:hypothetical protein